MAAREAALLGMLRHAKEIVGCFIFADEDPSASFIAYVRQTLNMNLDDISRYLIVWLAQESSEAQSFTLREIQDMAASVSISPIPEDSLRRSLDRLMVTSVVRERAPQVFEFSVPDYPLILKRLGDTAELERLEVAVEAFLQGSE